MIINIPVWMVIVFMVFIVVDLILMTWKLVLKRRVTKSIKERILGHVKVIAQGKFGKDKNV